MVSYEKIIRSFQMGTVSFSCTNGAAIFILCGVLCQLTLVLLSMDSYETATTDNGLKNQSYMYVDTWPVSLQLVEFQSKNRSPLALLLLQV